MQTGWGRTGDHFWGYQAHDIVPDMLTFAKGVGNGAALAGIVARAEIMDTIGVLNFSTFGGAPLAAAAGMCHHRLRRGQQPAGQRQAEMGRRFRDGLDALAAEAPWIAEVRGRRSHAGVRDGRARFARAVAGPGHRHAGGRPGRHGLLVGKGGLYGNVIRMAPMLNVTADEIDEGLAALAKAATAAT